MNPITTNKFNAIVGKTYIDKDGVIFKVQAFREFSSGTVVVTSAEKVFNLQPTEFQAFFDSIKSVDPGIVIPEKAEESEKMKFPKLPDEVIKKNELESKQKPDVVSVDVLPETTTSQSTKMKDALMEMLKMVKLDPKHIPQAKAMVDITNSVVNIQKVELQAIEMQNKFDGSEKPKGVLGIPAKSNSNQIEQH